MSTKNIEKKKWYVCEKCGKNLSNYHSLWRHKKKCTSNHVDGLKESILPRYEKVPSGAEQTMNSEPSSVKIQDDQKRHNKIPILKLKWNGSSLQYEKVPSGAKRAANSEPSSVKIQDDHKRRNKIPILKLKWNGSSWQRDRSCEKWYYQMKLGRDLDNLVRKRAINENVLNATQKSYLQMYREMFID